MPGTDRRLPEDKDEEPQNKSLETDQNVRFARFLAAQLGRSYKESDYPTGGRNGDCKVS